MENRKVKSRCIFIHENQILLCRDEKYDYYFFPGGSQTENETPEDTLRREIREEFGSEVYNIKILEMLKNSGQNSDETIAMFQASFSDPDIYLQSKIPLIDNPEIKAVWVPIIDVKNRLIKIFPEHNYLQLIE